MIDKSKIPEELYNDLIDLLGKESGEKLIKEKRYNFRALQNKVLSERLKNKYGKRFWIYFWIVIVIIAIVYEILRTNYLF